MQNRIEFIDLAKGVCILLVVSDHCGLPLSMPGCMNLRMPLYFILSGIFFKTYGGIFDFLRQKTNKILVPFLFFYFIAYFFFYVVNFAFPGLIKTDASGILDVFTQRQYFNGPIWFLICLFWTNIFFYLFQHFVHKEPLKALCVILFGSIGVLLSNSIFFLPCEIDVAMTALPFFYIGYLLKRTKLLIPNRWDRYSLLLSSLLLGVAICMECYCDVGHIAFQSNMYHGTFILDVVNAICSVLAVLLICKKIKHLPVVSYCGRYSIILLCTHHMYYRPLMVLFSGVTQIYNIYLTTVLTIVLCIISISLFKRYIPQFCAQKELLVQTIAYE